MIFENIEFCSYLPDDYPVYIMIVVRYKPNYEKVLNKTKHPFFSEPITLKTKEVRAKTKIMKIEFFSAQSRIVDSCSMNPYYNRDQNIQKTYFNYFLKLKKN